MIDELVVAPLEAWLEYMEQAAMFGETVCSLTMTPDETDEDFDESLRAAYVEAVDLMDRLRFVKAEIESVVGKAMPDDQMVVDFLRGGGARAINRRFSKRRSQWENDDLLRSIVRAVKADAVAHGADDEALVWISGAITEIATFYRLAGSNARVTAMKNRDIDPDEYCHTDGAAVSIQVVKP